MEMHYAYHPVEGSKCVATHEYYKLLENGWFDSPAKFYLPKEEIKVEEPITEEVVQEKKRGRPKRT